MSLDSMKQEGLTRRHWLTGSLTLAGLLGSGASIRAAMTFGLAPGLSFHMDQPYWDASGTAQPYRHAHGLRGAAVLEQMDEEAMRRLWPFH
jgi:hypothetical protein